MKATSPYSVLSDEAFWKKSVSNRPAEQIQPYLSSDYKIPPQSKVASIGSCFAQRITDRLPSIGLNHFVTEAGPPFLTAQERAALGYGVYSARYGNVYSSLQLMQLAERALGRLVPAEPNWRTDADGVVDPFRPAIQPGGFITDSECDMDRRQHLAKVREVFEQADVLIITLGLTETWVSAEDGCAFPVCPGAGLGGIFSKDRHIFINLTATEVARHLASFVEMVRSVNPGVQFILTVSPVPLIATFEPRHVMQSTVYSKSVLRVACEEVVRKHFGVHYFAAYEIVTWCIGVENAFHEDRRAVANDAVDQVVACFRRQFTSCQDVYPRVDECQEACRPAPDQSKCDEDEIIRAMSLQAMKGGGNG